MHRHTNTHTHTLPLLPQLQLSAEDTGITVIEVCGTHRPPLAIQVDLQTPALRGHAPHQPDCTCRRRERRGIEKREKER